MTDTSDKERERRRKKYKFALVQWMWHEEVYKVEYKTTLDQPWYVDHKVLCDDQPERVLRGMLKLLKEG